MSTYRLGLSFLEVPEGELPGPPLAHVYVKAFSLAEFESIKGAPLISANCVSFTEIEHQIDELKRELDTLKAEARKKFAAADRHQRERWARKQKEK